MKKVYCKDYTKIENYQLAKKDNFKDWVVHHRLETHFSDGTPRTWKGQLKPVELKALNMYYDRPEEELIYLTRAEHNKLHKTGQEIDEEHRKQISIRNSGRKPSKETLEKLSKARKGKKFSEEHKANLSKALMGHTVSEEQKKKQKETCIRNGSYINSDQTKAKKSKGHIGLKWFTNGVIEIQSFECPEGFRRGRLPRKH